MNVEVRLFARAKELAGSPVIELSVLEGTTVGDLRSRLAAHFPALSGLLPHCMFAIDMEYATDAAPVPNGAKLACIPPVSGG